MTDPQTPEPRSSRTGCWLALGLLAVIVAIGGILLFFSLFAFVSGLSGETVSVAKGSVLELDLAGGMPEGPPQVDLGPLFQTHITSHWELRRVLRAAAEDPKIVAVRVWIHGSALGWGGAEEVLSHLDGFRASGKPVHVLLQSDSIGDTDYFLATAGDRIWATPDAAVVINGLSAEAQFLRGALEKLRIEPEVIMYKEYKSAGEAFANYEMSEYMREALSAVLETMQTRFMDRVTERRGISREALETYLAEGMTPTTALLEAGLIDEIGYRDQIESALAEELGLDEYQGIRLSSYSKSLDGAGAFRDRVAVVFGEGQIIAEPIEDPFPMLTQGYFSGPIVARNIRRAAEDPKVKAIVFRVNSPGGSAVGSDLVRREIERAREQGKPVVVSMSDVAGSGGYWVSMDADEIVAHATTITGSIGVVFTRFNLEGFWDWVGIGVDRVKTAPNADLFGTGPMGPEDYEAINSWMEFAYQDFLDGVAEGRGLPMEQVREIAKGRIWSGRDALERGLVDHLGGFDLAIARARELAELDEDAPLMVYPKPKTLFQQLMEDGGIASTRSPELDPAALIEAVERLGRPQVQPLMPAVRID